MVGNKEAKKGNTPGFVKPGVFSQKCNEVGVHWLRISLKYKDLKEIVAWISKFFGKAENLARGLWGFDHSYRWLSGALLLYDLDPERCDKFHRGRIVFECQGGACDQLTGPDLLLLMEGFVHFEGSCKRIDVFYDDFAHRVEPSDLHKIVKQGDFTGFKKFQFKQICKANFGLMTRDILHDEVSFGTRGRNGTGKYLRCYDKKLESKGENDSVRWEMEFTQDKADNVFTVLAGCCGDIEAFVTICGALIGGAITFIHRSGEKNIKRLDVYAFWDLIVESLGKLVIRTEKKETTILGVIEWTERQVSPSLACVYRSFVSEQKFYAWLRDILGAGEARFNAKQRRLVEQHAKSIGYDPKTNEQQQESDYLRAMSGVE